MFLVGLGDYFATIPATVRLLAEFDFTIDDTNAYHLSGGQEDRFQRIAHETEQYLNRIFSDGIADGTIRPDCSSALVVPTITASLWFSAQQFALRSQRMSHEYGVAAMDIISCQIDLYIRAIRRV